MIRFKVLFIMLCVFIAIDAHSQDSTTTIKQNKLNTSAGIGLGLDYGGIGANILYYPIPKLGVFGGIGYAFAGFGYNVGAKFRIITKKEFPKIDPYLTAMYGYNAAVVVKDATEYNKLFYGPTVGAGIDFNPNSKKMGYWSLAILVPIRDSEVDQYFDYLKNNKGITFKNELLPIAISIGYRIKFN